MFAGLLASEAAERRQRGPLLWRTFRRQDEAFAFASTCTQATRVFAYEPAGSTCGRRRYLVASTNRFFDLYLRLPREDRCHYEVIPEGTPCRLYFDLEFNRQANPRRDGAAMARAVADLACAMLLKRYGLRCGWSDIVSLDSTTEKKFSRHLIVAAPRVVFRSFEDVGAFVRSMVAEMHAAQVASEQEAAEVAAAEAAEAALLGDEMAPGAETDATNEAGAVAASEAGAASAAGTGSGRNDAGARPAPEQEAEAEAEAEPQGHASSPYAFDQGSPARGPAASGDIAALYLRAARACSVRGKAGEPSSFIDMGVYTRNRNFRLFLSSKRGRQAWLTLSEDSGLAVEGELPETRARFVYARSLVSQPAVVADHSQLLRCQEPTSSGAGQGAASQRRSGSASRQGSEAQGG